MAKYAKTAGGNWSAAATWSATSSAGTDDAGAPAATDDVIFDSGATSAVVVDTTTCYAKTVTCQSANNAITFTAGKILYVSGSVTFYAGMTITGTGTLRINGVGTITSGGVTFPGDLVFNINGTTTLADNWTVTGLVSCLTATTTLNGYSITCNGGLTISATTQGTTNIIIGGTGGVITGSASYGFHLDLTINCTSCTFSGVFTYRTGTLTYTAGTVTVTDHILQISNAATIDTSGMTWNMVYLGTTQAVSIAITLLSDFSSDLIRFYTNGTVTFTGANVLCESLDLNYYANSATLAIESGRTLTVTTNLYGSGDFRRFYITTLKSVTASSPMYLVYQGTAANCKVGSCDFTDVDASGSAVVIYNWFGGTLLRTTNITNVTSSDLGAGGGLLTHPGMSGGMRG